MVEHRPMPREFNLYYPGFGFWFLDVRQEGKIKLLDDKIRVELLHQFETPAFSSVYFVNHN
jgi:hypothetical protein